MIITKPTLIKILSYSLLFFIMAGLFIYYGKDIYASFVRTDWWITGILVLLHIPCIALGGLAFSILCTRYDIRLHWQDWLGLSFIANFLNQLLPYRPGMGFRYLYLRHHYQMKTSHFLTIMLIYFLLTVLASTFFSVIGWIFSDLPKTFDHITLIALLIGIGILIGLLGIKLQNRFLLRILPLAHLHKIIIVLETLLDNPRVLFESLAILALINILSAFLFQLIFISIGAPIAFSICLFLIGIMSIAMIFPITPGNIGVLETLFGTLTQLLYQDYGIGFSAVALYRVSQWIPSLFLGTTFSFLLVGSIMPSLKIIKFGTNKMVD